jgi:hypothetical protein
MKRLIFVGVDNPGSDDPAEALHPDPPGGAGHRLWQMTGVSREIYLKICRVNMSRIQRFYSNPWSFFRTGDVVVVLGQDVRNWLRLPRVGIDIPIVSCGVTYYQIPHPSGCNRVYNDPEARAAVTKLLTRLCRRYKRLLKECTECGNVIVDGHALHCPRYASDA